MAVKPPTVSLFTASFLYLGFLFSSSSPIICASASNGYQTLVVRPLSTTRHSPTTQTTQLQQQPGVLQLDIFNHDDHLSPTDLNDITPEALLTNRLQRDAARVEALKAAVRRQRASNIRGKVIPGLAMGIGEYITRFGVGTPPSYMYMILDTGSDITWLQCSPCKACYHQKGPIFNSSKSATFESVGCRDQLCINSGSACSKTKSDKCPYNVTYGDGSVTFGDLAKETLTFGNKSSIEKVVFGCGRYNKGLFRVAAGLLGLGREELSFPSQLASRGLTAANMFSYCLVDMFSSSSSSSSIVFGDSRAAVSNVLYTPLLKNPRLNTFYYVKLNGVSVGEQMVKGINPSQFQLNMTTGKGGLVVDSGTTVTRLSLPAYLAMRDAFRKETRGLKSANTAAGDLFDTCYDLSGKSEVTLPKVAFHFEGAVVSLPANNYFIPVDSKGKYCFAFAGTNGSLSIFGNLQQQGFRVIYDLDNSKLGFAPHACAA